MFFFFFSSRRRHTRSKRDWSSDVCSSDLHATVEDMTRFRAWGLASRNHVISSTVAWIITGGWPSSIILHPPTVPSKTIGLFCSCVCDNGLTSRNPRTARKHARAYFRIIGLLLRLDRFLKISEKKADRPVVKPACSEVPGCGPGPTQAN